MRNFILNGMSVGSNGNIATYRILEITDFLNYKPLKEYVVSEYDISEMLRHGKTYKVMGIERGDTSHYTVYNEDSLPVYDYKYKNLIRKGNVMIVFVNGINSYIVMDETGKVRNGDVNDLFVDMYNNCNIYGGSLIDRFVYYSKLKSILLEDNANRNNANRFKVAEQIKQAEINENLLCKNAKFEYDIYKQGDKDIQVITGVKWICKQPKRIDFFGKAIDLKWEAYGLENNCVLNFSGMKGAVLFNIDLGISCYGGVPYEYTIVLPEKLSVAAKICINCYNNFRGMTPVKLNIINADKLIYSQFIVVASEVSFDNKKDLVFNIWSNAEVKYKSNQFRVKKFLDDVKAANTNLMLYGVNADTLTVNSKKDGILTLLYNSNIGKYKNTIHDKDKIEHTSYLLNLYSYLGECDIRNIDKNISYHREAVMDTRYGRSEEVYSADYIVKT